MAALKILPPPSPNRDKFPFVASVRFGGMDIDVENLDGSTRTGTNASGKTWKTVFAGAHYGEIRGSKGTDKDAVDVYIKNPPDDSGIVYIVHQNHPGDHPTKAGTFDEDKVILGVKSPEKAKELYLQHYSRKDFFRSLTVMKLSEFKRQIFGESRGEKIAMIKTAQEAYALGVKLALDLCGLKTAGDPWTADNENVKAFNAGFGQPGQVSPKALVPKPLVLKKTLGDPLAATKTPAPQRVPQRLVKAKGPSPS